VPNFVTLFRKQCNKSWHYNPGTKHVTAADHTGPHIQSKPAKASHVPVMQGTMVTRHACTKPNQTLVSQMVHAPRSTWQTGNLGPNKSSAVHTEPRTQSEARGSKHLSCLTPRADACVQPVSQECMQHSNCRGKSLACR
jgi:hypothetical protein